MKPPSTRGLCVLLLLVLSTAPRLRAECDSAMETNMWSDFIREEPQWAANTIAATYEDLATNICAAQGASFDPVRYECDLSNPSLPTPIHITLTNHISLRGRRLPQIYGSLKISGACGESGRCTIHAVSESCSNCPTIWEVPEYLVPQYDACNDCSEAPLSEFRWESTPLRVVRSSSLWLEDLELIGAHSSSSGGLLSTEKGDLLVWSEESLKPQMTFVQAQRVRFAKGFSAQQGGAAAADQGCLMVLRECEFDRNFAGPDHRDKEALSAHDVSVLNHARVIVEAATPAVPSVRESSLLDVDRELGQCVIATYMAGRVPPAPPPSPPLPPQPVDATTPGILDLDDDDSDDGGGSFMTTRLIIIIAVSLGGSAFIMCLAMLCCCVSTREEDKNLTPVQRGKRNFSRSLTSGLQRMGTLRPGYVQQGDFIANLVEEQQEAQAAADSANRRADRLEKQLQQQGRRPASRGYVKRMGASMGSAFRSLSIAIGRAGSRPMASDVVSVPESNRAPVTPLSGAVSYDFKLPNQAP